jgi:hypothetical protein
LLELQQRRGFTGIFPKALDGQCYCARKCPLVDLGVGVVRSCRVGSVAEVIAASLSVTFFFVFIASGVPFFCRRVVFFRLLVFGWLLPAICAAVVTQIFRSVFHLS